MITKMQAASHICVTYQIMCLHKKCQLFPAPTPLLSIKARRSLLIHASFSPTCISPPGHPLHPPGARTVHLSLAVAAVAGVEHHVGRLHVVLFAGERRRLGGGARVDARVAAAGQVVGLLPHLDVLVAAALGRRRVAGRLAACDTARGAVKDAAQLTAQLSGDATVSGECGH